ncbi:hypothetical protein BDV96DRAFT_104773 [Lophiotrema nucula]|uniref:Uncharacterized protein n=1 Tax=Lophiotrema nucula TaxID=690887 RepID=A0A6A5Z4A9_9PLEO|nr:hypothetical protein BDV96DRAFT_104773 [Lophiotrema nucula]
MLPGYKPTRWRTLCDIAFSEQNIQLLQLTTSTYSRWLTHDAIALQRTSHVSDRANTSTPKTDYLNPRRAAANNSRTSRSYKSHHYTSKASILLTILLVYISHLTSNISPIRMTGKQTIFQNTQLYCLTQWTISEGYGTIPRSACPRGSTTILDSRAQASHDRRAQVLKLQNRSHSPRKRARTPKSDETTFARLSNRIEL